MGSIAGIVTAVSTGLKFAGQQQDAQSASMRGRFQQEEVERNAQIAEKQRDSVLNVGDLEENRMRGETAQTVSTGRASAAARGVEVGAGSSAQVTSSQELVGDVDALTIRNNAARQAWGYDVEAANDRMNGKLAAMAGENEAATDRMESVTTLLSGASSLYGLYRKRTPKDGN